MLRAFASPPLAVSAPSEGALVAHVRAATSIRALQRVWRRRHVHRGGARAAMAPLPVDADVLWAHAHE